MAVISPNTRVQPHSAQINSDDHLVVGGCDTVELASRFGTPLYLLDELTIRKAAEAVKQGLAQYPESRILYAGKAFLCLAMCHLIDDLGLGLDVVSAGELYTARAANFPPELIYMHGNNKSRQEIEAGLQTGAVNIVVDNASELALVGQIANELGKKARILFRVTPGVVPDTHHYIATGHTDSKFGLPLAELQAAVALALEQKESIQLVGLHTHIGSQSHEIEPYLEMVEILADCFQEVKLNFGLDLPELNIGGGLGIAYLETDRPMAIYDWAQKVSSQVSKSFRSRQLPPPFLVVEPGRSIVGTAGVTLYRAGHSKLLPGGLRYLAVDGGMADNPRPITYQAKYTACIANRMSSSSAEQPLTLAGKYCESGDIIIKDTYLAADTGDLIAIFDTGAYNYSMASNYNRTGRPACVLLSEGRADAIIERETNADLLRQDRVPDRLLRRAQR
jgi:diaminopimelate decarboxylase